MTASTDSNGTLYVVGAAQDAAGLWRRPAQVLVRGGLILHVGSPDGPRGVLTEGARVVEMPDHLLLPGLVNAHAHLSLTGVGRRAYDGDFQQWLRMVIEMAPREREAVIASVARGAAMSREAGVLWVGDIAPSIAGIEGVARSELEGVSFLECLGFQATAGEIEPRIDEASALWGEWAEQSDRSQVMRDWRVSFSPHAPYSTSPAVYAGLAAIARETRQPLCTHLAETVDEIAFVRHGTGPFRRMLEAIGRWDDSYEPPGVHPLKWMEPWLGSARWLLAHCNYVSKDHLHLLARRRASVAYCPIASEYFGHPVEGRAPHRYREMMRAGVNVCLGTDSIICQPQDEAQPLGILPQMRRLYRRDGTDPSLLLRMATTNGVKALGGDWRRATLSIGNIARMIGVRFDRDDETDPLTQVLGSDYAVDVIIEPTGKVETNG